jgi:hypothetical protein
VSAGQAELDRDTADGLKALIDVALEISNLKEFLGREKPTVITVSMILLTVFAILIGLVSKWRGYVEGLRIDADKPV